MNKIFEAEIEKIQSEDYRNFMKFYLDEYVPKYFYTVGASSSGKYHPQFSQGKGGLVRHTKAVVMFAEELLRMSSYGFMSDEYKDYVYMACIAHDTAKYGLTEEMDTKAYENHAELASLNVSRAWYEYFEYQVPELLIMAIKAHMGQWSTCRDDRPFTPIDRVVHLADYMASRNFIDIPTLKEEAENENN